MTNKEKKQWLKSYRALNDTIEQKLEEIQRIQSLATKMTQVMTGMPHGGNSDKESTYVKLIELKREIDGDIDRYIDLRNEIEKAILSVGDIKLQNLLRYKYIDGLSFEQIAVAMHHDYWYVVHELHPKALTKLQLDVKPPITPNKKVI